MKKTQYIYTVIVEQGEQMIFKEVEDTVYLC